MTNPNIFKGKLQFHINLWSYTSLRTGLRLWEGWTFECEKSGGSTFMILCSLLSLIPYSNQTKNYCKKSYYKNISYNRQKNIKNVSRDIGSDKSRNFWQFLTKVYFIWSIVEYFFPYITYLPLNFTINKSYSDAHDNIASVENFVNLHIKVHSKMHFPEFAGWSSALWEIDSG